MLPLSPRLCGGGFPRHCTDAVVRLCDNRRFEHPARTAVYLKMETANYLAGLASAYVYITRRTVQPLPKSANPSASDFE